MSVSAGQSWYRDIAVDGRIGYRKLVRAPWRTATAVVSIAVSTTVIVAMFCVVVATELRNLPYAHSERLSVVFTRHDSASSAPGLDGPGLTYAAFSAYHRRARSFERLEAVAGVMKREVIDGELREPIAGRAATVGFLSMLSVRPLIGRWMVDEDTLPGAPRVIILSHAFWINRYAGDPNVIGRQIGLRDLAPAAAPVVKYTIVGVLPRNFVWRQQSHYWIPLGAGEPRATNAVAAVGLLDPNIAERTADAEARAIAGDLRTMLDQNRPPGDRSLGGSLELRVLSAWTYLHEHVGGRAGRFALLAIALAVLVLAIANVLSLRLAEAQGRHTEFAIRAALGASPARITRQMLVEALILTVPACLIGFVMSPPLIRLIAGRLNLAALGVAPSVDWSTVLLAAVVASSVTGVLGLGPGLFTASRDVAGGSIVRNDFAVTKRIVRAHQVFVMIEAAMAVVVLTGAGLVVRELRRLSQTELGFDPSGVVEIAEPRAAPRPPAEVIPRGYDAADRLRRVAGVTGVAITAADLAVHLRAEGAAVRLPTLVPRAVLDVTPEVFALLGIPILAGRAFGSDDDASHPSVVMLSLEAARRLFPGENPVGKRLALAGMGPSEPEAFATVVGIVGDARLRGNPINPRQAVVYRPFAQGRPIGLRILVKGGHEQPPSFAALRRATRPLARAPTAQWAMSSVEDDVARYLAEPRFTAASLSSLAALGLLLAVVGIFGVTAYSVSVRTREMAIRIALGARHGSIVMSIVTGSVLVVATGIVAGLLLSTWLSRFLHDVLHGTSPFAPSVWIATPSVLLLTAVVASLLPAARALRIDPARILRAE